MTFFLIGFVIEEPIRKWVWCLFIVACVKNRQGLNVMKMDEVQESRMSLIMPNDRMVGDQA